MDYLIVAFAAVAVSCLTFFSGFGLGTLLMPVFALFFPVEVAVGATAIVHGANSLFKVLVVGGRADRDLILRFGLPAIVAALAGAWALGWVAHQEELARYMLGSRQAVITPLKLSMACILILFSLFELLPGWKRLRMERRHLFLGGLLSGFFGGFSGHQGAMRSLFLLKTGVSTETFVGTNACIAGMVDMARITVYGLSYFFGGTQPAIQAGQWPLIATGVLAAFSGVLLGRRYLRKVTMGVVQTLSGILLFLIALALAAGII